MAEDRQDATSTDESTDESTTDESTQDESTQDETQTSSQEDESQSSQPNPAPQSTPEPEPTDDGDEDDDEDDDLDLDDENPITRGEARKIRREIAKYRTERNREREQRKAAEARAKSLQRKQTLQEAARAKGADPDLTFGFLSSQDKVSDLDPSDDEAAAALVEAAVESKPNLIVDSTPAPRRSGGEFTGDEPSGPDPSQMDMDAYVKWRAERDSKDE